MKQNIRFLFGLVSSLLLTCGFASAAQHFDPVHKAFSDKLVVKKNTATPDCIFTTNIAVDGN